MSANVESSSFYLLDSRIQKWIWSNGWTSLRDAQEQALPFVLKADTDVIIAAATASGKTEAALLPVLTHMLQPGNDGTLVLYLSPLKALINDQFLRMEQLCEELQIPVFKWHGDVASSLKTRFFKKPSGIVLITPESLEAMFCNHGSQIKSIFERTKYILVDELHAFIGTERGKQLQSLIHRVEKAVNRFIPRIGLSATLGDMQLGAEFLRPRHASKCIIVKSNSDVVNLQIQLKAYLIPRPTGNTDETEPEIHSVQSSIAEHLFKHFRGCNNLIFPNSKSDVEIYTYKLKKLCEDYGVPNEYWPHHGSLSKMAREETELALKDKTKFSTALCTNTLELGIDIGDVVAVAQINCPPSVSSLRQRLGRSGRREGTSSILRGYITIAEIDARSSLDSLIRLDLFEYTAMISLLIENWFEPPAPHGLHLSTFIQQLLSVIAQHGGVTASSAYKLLVESGPFDISKSQYIELLRHLGTKKIIEQDSSGILLLGEVGEPYLNHYSFYSAFATAEEFRLYSGTEMLGTIPVTTCLFLEQIIIFSGRTWKIMSIDEESKIIQLVMCKGGKALQFSSLRNGNIHDRIRLRMRELYLNDQVPRFLDKEASRQFLEGQKYFKQFYLQHNWLISQDGVANILTWKGDHVNFTLSTILKINGFIAESFGGIIEVTYKPAQGDRELLALFKHLVSQSPVEIQELLHDASVLQLEKWDWALPDSLLKQSYASLRVDVANVYSWMHSVISASKRT